MPASATAEQTSRPPVPPTNERISSPAAASTIASSAVRSSPMRWPIAGVATPNTAKAAVGTMPSTPVMVGPKPNALPSTSSSGVSEVTAVRRLNAASRMPVSTSHCPLRCGGEEGMADGGIAESSSGAGPGPAVSRDASAPAGARKQKTGARPASACHT